MTEEEKIEQLLAITQSMYLMMDEFNALSETNTRRSLESTEILNRSIQNLQSNNTQFLKDAEPIIQKGAIKAIDTTVVEKFSTLEKRINSLCENVDYSSNQINAASNAVTKQTKMTGWTVLVSSILAGIAIIGFSIWYGWGTKQQVDINEEKAAKHLELYNRIEFGIKVKEAIKAANFTMCDGDLCYEYKEDPKRYDKNKDYIVIPK